MAGWNIITNITLALNKRLGYQTMRKVRDNMVALASARLQHALGGSRTTSVPLSASVQNAQDYIDIELDGTALAGLTVQARVEVRTDDGGTSVTPSIRRTTNTATDMVTGAACTATAADFSGTDSKQTLVFTPTAGVNTYRMRLLPGNASAGVYGIGYVEIFATS